MKACKLCKMKVKIHYKNVNLLKKFISDRGRILHSRVTKNCAKHQRQITVAIKRARILALLPFYVK